MINWRFFASFLLAACACLVLIAAHAGSLMVLGTGSSGPQVFLPTCTGQFSPTNYSPNSNDFNPADGFWSATNSGSSNPTAVVATGQTLPDGTTGSVTQVTFGTVPSGTTNYSVLQYTDTHTLGSYPLSHGVWAKVISGTGNPYTSIT